MPFSTDYLIDYTRNYFVREIVIPFLANFYLIIQLFPLSFPSRLIAKEIVKRSNSSSSESNEGRQRYRDRYDKQCLEIISPLSTDRRRNIYIVTS